jgi:16S rRNA processing protein RimM
LTDAPRIELGRVVRPVGLRGELKLKPSADYWFEALASEHLSLERAEASRPVRVEGSRPAGDCVVLRIAGLGSRDEAEAQRDALLILTGLDDVPPPEQLRPFQVVGMRVWHVNGTELGAVTDLLPMPAQPLLEVAGRYLIPCVEPILRSLDLEAGRIEVDPPEGLLEL